MAEKDFKGTFKYHEKCDQKYLNAVHQFRSQLLIFLKAISCALQP